MADLQDLLSDVRSGMAQAPDRTLLRALQRAAVYFFAQSHAWRAQIDTINLQAGVARYDVDAPPGAIVERVMVAKVDGSPMRSQLRPRELFMLQELTGRPSVFAIDQLEQVIALHPTPGSSEDGIALDLFAVIVPTESIRQVPDSLMHRYRPGIVAYARADMFGLHPEMPWHNPKEATSQRALGDEYMTRAKRDQVSGGHVELRVQPRAFI